MCGAICYLNVTTLLHRMCKAILHSNQYKYMYIFRLYQPKIEVVQRLENYDGFRDYSYGIVIKMQLLEKRKLRDFLR